MTEEELKKKIGTANPFRVPDGYFEGFADNMMRLLPERETSPVAADVAVRNAAPAPARRRLWRPWLYAAAALCAVAFIIGAVHRTDHPSAPSYVAEYNEEEMSDFMATSFFDEYTLYSYLTEEE